MSGSAESLLTLPDVATRLNVSQRTVRNWLRGQNPPPHFRLNGTCLRFRVSEVERWVERQRQQTGGTISPADVEALAEEAIREIQGGKKANTQPRKGA